VTHVRDGTLRFGPIPNDVLVETKQSRLRTIIQAPCLKEPKQKASVRMQDRSRYNLTGMGISENSNEPSRDLSTPKARITLSIVRVGNKAPHLKRENYHDIAQHHIDKIYFFPQGTIDRP